MNTPSPVWHPYTQMQTAPEPLSVVKGEGSYLITSDGRRIFDGISSWWVTLFGHGETSVAKAISQQAYELEQVIFAGFTHPQAERLAKRLTAQLPENLKHVFFSDDGSTAVEVALKMAWQFWDNQGESRSHLLAFEGAYHGDTFGAMSVSGRSIFTKAFDPLLFEVAFLPSPSEANAELILEKLEPYAETAAGLIVEPLVQGAGGMLMHSPETLDKVTGWCKEKGIPVIFDEVMTGFGRTGSMFAADDCEVKPDIICLSKGLTAGFLPLSVTACSSEIYEVFLSNDRTRTLFHGHSFTANPLGCAAANAGLDLLEKKEVQEAHARLCQMQAEAAKRFAKLPMVENVRSRGTILAMDLKAPEGGGYLDPVGPKIAAWFMERNILLRPLGNVLYLMPPYLTDPEDLTRIYAEMEAGLQAVGGKNPVEVQPRVDLWDFD